MDKIGLAQERIERVRELHYEYDQQAKRTIDRCNICQSDRWIEITQVDRYGFAAKACGCMACGIVFLNPVMTENSYRYFYQSVYRKLVSAYHGRLIDAVSIQVEQREYAVDLADFVAHDLIKKEDATLLDIGGSTGIISLYLKNTFGLLPLVLDPSPDEIQQAQKLGLATHSGLLEDFSPEGRSFDLIILCQTIDHLLDVQGSLSKIWTLMNEHSLLFVDIVDFRAAYLRNWSVEEAVKLDHPFYFTQESVQTAFKRVGLEIIRIRYAKDKLHIGYLCKKSAPDRGYLPDSARLDSLWSELRLVQNTQR